MEALYRKILEFRAQGVPLVLITAVEKQGSGPVEVGKKMIVTNLGHYVGTVGGGTLEHYAINKAKSIFTTRKPLMERYALTEGEIIPDVKTLPMVCGGVVTLFYEYIGALEEVVVFGGGHVGQALTPVLKSLDYRVSVVDPRPEICERFVGADEVKCQGFVEYLNEMGVSSQTFYVVCTPSHTQDYHVLNKVLESGVDFRYLGLLCSPQKLDDYLSKTYEAHTLQVRLTNFYAPIGLDLGGNRPEDIAISIASEILAIANQRPNQMHMRESRHGTYRYWENE